MSDKDVTGWLYERGGVTFSVTGRNPVTENLVDAVSTDGLIRASFYFEDVVHSGQKPVLAEAA